MLVMSFHGVPERTLHAGRPLPLRVPQDGATAGRATGAAARGIPRHLPESRFGKAKWLEPYTEPTLRELAREGHAARRRGLPRLHRRLPGDAGRDRAGRRATPSSARAARSFTTSPASTTSPTWIDALAELAMRHLQGWDPTALGDRSAAPTRARHCGRRAELKRPLGAAAVVTSARGSSAPPAHQPRQQQHGDDHGEQHRRHRPLARTRPNALADRQRVAHLRLGQRARGSCRRSPARSGSRSAASPRRAGRCRTCRNRSKALWRMPYTPTVAKIRMPAYSCALRDLQQLDPQAHQRQVQHQQHHVADVQRRDQRPHQRRRCLRTAAGRAGCRSSGTRRAGWPW